ncbi:hypothetical protein MOSE0_L01442 [Monosporozyma servazzii]
MSQENCEEEEKIVLMCDFCRKYNITNERAMALGIDNCHLERITEQEFNSVVSGFSKDTEGLGFKHKRSFLFPFEGEQAEIGLNVSLSQMFEGDTFTTKSELENVMVTEKNKIPRQFEFNMDPPSLNLLYSEVTVEDTKYDLLESSLPPPEMHETILVSEDNNFDKDQTQTLLYTSES